MSFSTDRPRTSLPLLSLLVLLIMAGSLEAQSRIVNGTFDSNLGGWVTAGDVEWSPVNASGTNSGSALIRSDGPIGLGFLYQIVPVQPGQRFRFEASVRVDGETQALVILAFCATNNCIEGDAEEEPVATEAFSFSQGVGFQKRSTLTTVPAGATIAVPFLLPTIQFSGNIYYDDIILASGDDPIVVVTTSPDALVQTVAGGATTTYTLQNIGMASTQITLSQDGDFFQQSPSAFTLEPGAAQVVTVTALPASPGLREGRLIPQGNGVPAGLAIPIRVLTSEPPGGPVEAAPATNRVDLSSDAGDPAAGSVRFTNSGTGTLRGTVVSDVDWIIPQSDTVVIPPGGTADVSFAIDPSQRTDGGSLGSETGTLTLVFLNGGGGAKSIGPRSNHGATSSASVAVAHTVTPATAAAAIPSLPPGEIALFMPGVSHVVGSVGTFLSDVTLTSLGGLGGLPGANLFFRPLGNGSPATSTNIPAIPLNRPLQFSDIALGVFRNGTSVGTLQLRSSDVDRISASATVLNSSNSAGTYGTSIPVFRSDRSTGAGESIFLTGMLSDDTNHTNLYFQETAGGTVEITSAFLAANGDVLSSRTDTLTAFAATQIGRVAPEGALAARITVAPGSTGRIVSYATPVDRASGDTWAVVDWGKQYNYLPNVPVVIPVAGSLRGANNTHFRTDLAVSNSGTTASSGRLRYYSRTGEVVDRTLNLAAGESRIISDVLVTLFNVTGDAVGYLEYTPSSGSAVMTSRTYTTVSGAAATFGAAVPTLPMSAALGMGGLRRFGGIDDASLATTQAGRPATFRTNLGLVEVSGQPATVRVTLYFSPSPRSAVRGVVTGTFNLAANRFMQINGVTRALLGAGRDTNYGDLRNMQLDVEVVGGAGRVMTFTSTIDNGTGDSILRVD